MTSPADRARVNLDAAERVARRAMTGDGASLTGEWFSEKQPGGPRYEVIADCEGSIIAESLHRETAAHMALMDPARTLDVIADARATLDRHAPMRPFDVLAERCCDCHRPWPCPDAADVLATWGSDDA